MADINLVQLLAALLFIMAASARGEGPLTGVYLGEKKLDGYSERYYPILIQDTYSGKLSFEDDLFFQRHFQNYTFPQEGELSSFLRSELNAGLVCPNVLLKEHWEDMRFSYRLITLSYLLEGQWHMKLYSDHFKLKDGCDFDLQNWLKSCGPTSESMKKFVGRLKKFGPRYPEEPPLNYKKEDWWKTFSSGRPQTYSQYKMQDYCKTNCRPEDMASRFKLVCQENQALMNLICSEKDELYGLSAYRDAYALIGQSNIINTFNRQGEAMGCLRRFSEVMSPREVRYAPLNRLFPVLQNFLRQRYQERFLQGRVFFYGAGKEFEEKGLEDLYVKEQRLDVAQIPEEKAELPLPLNNSQKKKPEIRPEKIQIAETVKPIKVPEMKTPVKSAFLQAAELRSTQNMEQVEVDMLKLKYDYVFTLNQMNTLSERLKTFMTREALTEMMTYDKLGTREGPVPLLFLKFLIDMQEHQGLWNIIAVIGDKFYVTNEIDEKLNPPPEYIQLVNNESTGRQWQIYVLKP